VGVLGASAVVLGFISSDVWGTLFEVGESIKVTLTFCFRRREELRASMLARHYYRKDTSLHFHSDTRSGVQGRMLLFSGVGSWNSWSYTFPVGRSRFLSAGIACSGDSSRGGDAWAGGGGATGALLWWTLGDLSKRSGYNLYF
jgi:hypothetical protein